jgi:four helix bundle protein
MTTLYMESVALASDVRSLLAPIMRKDQGLGRRLKRAADEVPEHLAEGMSNTGRVRRSEYGAALGSAKEALACVRAAASVGYLSERERLIEGRLEQLMERMRQDFR